MALPIPCFGLLAPRMVRQYISIVLSHPVSGPWLEHTYGMITPPSVAMIFLLILGFPHLKPARAKASLFYSILLGLLGHMFFIKSLLMLFSHILLSPLHFSLSHLSQTPAELQHPSVHCLFSLYPCSAVISSQC